MLLEVLQEKNISEYIFHSLQLLKVCAKRWRHFDTFIIKRPHKKVNIGYVFGVFKITISLRQFFLVPTTYALV